MLTSILCIMLDSCSSTFPCALISHPSKQKRWIITKYDLYSWICAEIFINNTFLTHSYSVLFNIVLNKIKNWSCLLIHRLFNIALKKCYISKPVNWIHLLALNTDDLNTNFNFPLSHFKTQRAFDSAVLLSYTVCGPCAVLMNLRC